MPRFSLVVRSLRRGPLFTVAAVSTLGLGAVFSVADGTLFRHGRRFGFSLTGQAGAETWDFRPVESLSFQPTFATGPPGPVGTVSENRRR
jgi:hypothetical protein